MPGARAGFLEPPLPGAAPLLPRGGAGALVRSENSGNGREAAAAPELRLNRELPWHRYSSQLAS